MSSQKNESLKDLMSVVNSTDVGLIILDKHYSIRVWNLFMVNHSGLTVESVMGKNLFELFPDISKQWFSEKVKQSITQKKNLLSTWEEQAYLFKFKNIRSRSTATYMYQNLIFIPLTSATGNVDNFAITVNDVTDIAASTQQLDVVIRDYSQMVDKDD